MNKLNKIVIMFYGLGFGLVIQSVLNDVHTTLPASYMTGWDAFRVLFTLFAFMVIGVSLIRLINSEK